MVDGLERWLAESPTAKRIALSSAVVVARTEMSPRDVAAVRKAGTFGPVPPREELCELVVGGQCVAEGKIVRRKGAYYFKAIRLAELPGAAGGEKEAKR